jgi:hypothetical protein
MALFFFFFKTNDISEIMIDTKTCSDISKQSCSTLRILAAVMNCLEGHLYICDGITYPGASMAEWLSLATSNHSPLTVVGVNPFRNFEVFHVR